MADETIITELVVDARGAVQGTAEYEAAMRAAGRAANAAFTEIERKRQADENASTSAGQNAKATQDQSTAFTAASRAANTYLSRLDPVFNATQRLGRESTSVVAAQKGLEAQLLRGVVTVDQYNQRMALLDGRLGEIKATSADLAAGTVTVKEALASLSTPAERAGGAFGKASGAMRQFGIQSIDVFTQLQSGAPIMTTFIQQGSQILQVAANQTGVLGALKSAFAALISPIGLAVTATVTFVGGIVALGVASESSQRQLGQLQNSLRLVTADYKTAAEQINATAKAIAATTSIGTSDARTAGVQLFKFSTDTSDLERLIKLSADLAAVWGVDLADASKQLAIELNDPAKAIQDLANKDVPGFTQALARTTAALQAGGDKFTAQRLLIDQYSAAMKGAADPPTALGKAIKDLNDEFTKTGHDGRSFADALGSVITGAAASAIEQVTALLKAIKELKAYVDSLTPKDSSGNTQNDLSFWNFIKKGISPVLPSWLWGVTSSSGSSSTGSNQQVLTNPTSGALGIMQVMPDTQGGTTRYGQDLTTTFGNVWAGITDFITKLEKQSGNLDLALANYGGYTSTDAASGYLNKIKSANISSLPTDVSQLIGDIANRRGVGQYADVLRGIAVVESGGKQYVAKSVTVNETDLKATTSGGGAAGTTTDQWDVGTTPSSKSRQTNSTQLDALYAGTSEAQRAQIEKTIETAKRLRDEVGANSEEGKKYTAVIQEQQAKLNGLQTPMDALKKSLRDQVEQSGVADGAAREYVTALQSANDAARSHGESVASAADQEAVLEATHQRLTNQYRQSLSDIDRQTAANETFNASIGDAIGKYGSYTAAAQHLANVEKARETLKATTMESEADYKARLEETTAALDRQTSSLNSRNLQPALEQQQKDIDLLNAQTQALSLSSEEQTKYIAVFKARQTLESQNIDVQSELGAKYIENASKISDLTASYSQQKQALSDVASAFTSAFDSIADGITNSLLQGAGAAVNWKNIMVSVAQQVLSQFLKFTVLQPILNSLFGQSGTTTSSIISALSSLSSSGSTSSLLGGSSSSGSGSIIDSLSNAGTVVSAGNTLTGGWLLDSLGITGSNGLTGTLSNWFSSSGSDGGGIISSIKSLFSDGGFFGSGGTVSNILNSGILGTSSIQATNTALSGLGAGVYGPATAADVASSTTGILGGASVGSLLSGVGGGFGVGSLVGGLVSNWAGKDSNLGGNIGAGTGAVAGAAIGSIVPGVGTVIGGLLGGLLGGAGGGLIGAPKKNPYSHTEVGLSDSGLLEIGKSYSQLLDSNRQDVQDYVDSVNNLLTQGNVRIDANATSSDVWGNYGKGNQSNPWMKGENVSDMFVNLRFKSDDPTLNKLLKDQSFSSDDLTNLINNYNSAQASIKDFITNTMNPLVDLMKDGARTVTEKWGTHGDTINSINDTYDQAIAKAKEYASSMYASDEQIAQLTKAETDLADARTKAIAAVDAADWAAVNSTITGYNLRAQSAQATRSGDVESQKQVALAVFDANAQSERDQLTASLTSTFGQVFKSTESYAVAMAALEKALGEERLNTAKQYDDQIAANAKAAAEQAAAIDAQRLSAFQTSESYSVRYWNANANITGSLDDAKNAALFSQQVSADQERTALISKYKAIFGDAYAQSYEYWIESLRLEQALGEERLEIQKTYNDKIAAANDNAAQTAASTISSITDYVKGLQTGTNSALSSQSKYDLATSQFNAVLGSAQAGDFNSIQQITSYADTLLTASRNIYGSGAGYAADFNRVLDALSKISTTKPDDLVASVIKSTSQTQIQALQTGFDTLKAALDKLTTEVRQANNRPASLSAAA